MPVATIQFKSAAFEGDMTFTALLPDPLIPPPYSVLVQLHGKYDSHTSWLYKSKLAEYVSLAKLPLVVLLPDGGNGMWADMYPNAPYESMIVEDLWRFAHTMFPIKHRQKWAIGGLSMGGYGALRLGLKFPEIFNSVYAHSSVIPDQTEITEWFKIKGKTKQDMDCFYWASKRTSRDMPRLSFDCGTEDGLIEHNRRFRDFLKKSKLSHTYSEHPGGHDWVYWDTHVQTALKQHAEVLKLQSPK